jgi:hypothetical protein
MRTYALFALALVTGACTGARSRAETAIAAAEQALAPIAPEAGRVVPDQLKPLTDAVTVAKDYLARKEYDSAYSRVVDIPAKTDSLAQAIVKEKTSITEEINVLNTAMPRNLAALKTKIDQLSRRRLPRGLEKAEFDSVKTTHAEAVDEWPQIMTAFTNGQLHDAITRATALKLKVSHAMEAVGMTADARAWSNQVGPST